MTISNMYLFFTNGPEERVSFMHYYREETRTPLPQSARRIGLFSCGAEAYHCRAFSCWWAQGAWASTIVAHGLSGWVHWPLGTGSKAVVHRLSCSIAFGIFLDQGSNLCLLHWQANSSPLSTREALKIIFLERHHKSDKNSSQPSLYSWYLKWHHLGLHSSSSLSADPTQDCMG